MTGAAPASSHTGPRSRHPAPVKPASSPALIALRDHTRHLHADLEARLVLARPSAGREEYAQYVAAMWGWLKPLEPALWHQPWPAAVEPQARAGKVHWLAEDLDAARADGCLATAPLPCAEAPLLPDAASRFGWAYVIEGSMLGGQVLKRRLGVRLRPWPMRYLEGYGERTVRRWQDFLAALAREVTSGEDIARAATAAAGAFAHIDTWLARRGLA